MSTDTMNPMANMKAGVIADLTANGDRLNEIAKAHAESQKATSSDKFALRDKTPLTEISDETVRKAISDYRDNVAKLNAAIKAQKDAIAPVIGVKDSDEFDKDSARKEYLDLKGKRAITIQYATKTNLMSEDEVKALPAVMSWGGGTVSDAAAAAMRPRFSDMTITKGDHTETVKPHTSGELAKVLNKKCKGQEGWTKVSSSDMTALFVGAAPENNLKKVVGNLVITVGGWTVTATPDAAAPTTESDEDSDEDAESDSE
jgi:hypothetical protein